MSTRSFTWFACALLVASLAAPKCAQCGSHSAQQGVPPDNKSTLQGPFIDVEGSTNGLPDNCSDLRCGSFAATIRDFANNPIPGSTVIIDFSGCPDIQLSCDQLFATTGQTLLAGKKVMGTTNAVGQFVFHVQGAANAVKLADATSDGTNAGVPCAQFYADGVPLTPTLEVSAFDLDGLGSPFAAVSVTDVSLTMYENIHIALGAQARQRDDYNHTGTVNVADVAAAAAMAAQAALGTGSQATGPYCP